MGQSAVANVCDMLAHLAWGPKTTVQLSDAIGISRTTTYRWLRELQAVGLIDKQGHKMGGGSWYLNRYPHHTAELVDGAAEYASWDGPMRHEIAARRPVRRHTLAP